MFRYISDGFPIRALFGFICLTLAGCASPDPKPSSQAISPMNAPPAEMAQKASEQPAPSALPALPPPSAKTAALAPLKTEQGSIVLPASLIGLSHFDVGKLLGPPSFKRQDAPAQIWQYGGVACLLDIFLYGKGGNGTLVVAHSEARNRDGAKAPQKDCLASLIKERRAKSG